MTLLQDDVLTDAVVLPEIKVQHLGPVWELNPDYDGVSIFGPRARYIMPEFSLGHQVWAWVRENMLAPDANEFHQDPFLPTYEQYRFVLWWYAVDERGRWLFRRGVLQRIKGWGKDPVGAVISAVEFLGPCRFGGWALEDMPDLGERDNYGTPAVQRGDPVAIENPNAWIQIAAVSKTQTQNTMLLFPSLFTKECLERAYMRPDSIGVTKVTAFRGRRQIQAVTSNPSALEGGRPSFVLKNETEWWVEANRGWDMDAVIDRNAAKSKGGNARSLSICNAPEPSEESVGRRERDAYLSEEAGLSFKTGVLYDSLELDESVPLLPPGIDKLEPDQQETLIMTHLQACIKAVKGDSWWLDEERIALEILDQKNSESTSRRFYFNQAAAAEDAWLDPKFVNAAIDPLAGVLRTSSSDQIRVGWEIVNPHDPIVMFFDGSKSDDSTGLVGCRLSDGYCFTIGIWTAPPRRRGKAIWLAPRGEVDTRVDEAFERFNIVGFWGDPSHTKDDESGSGYWDGLFDDWHRRFKDKLGEHWAVKTGNDQHAIMWDMAAPHRTKQFVEAAERTVDDFETLAPDGTPAPKISLDGHPRLLEHLKNAKSAPGRYGVSLRKEGRESLRKIDLGVCLVGARMLRRIVLNSVPEPEAQKGGWARTV